MSNATADIKIVEYGTPDGHQMYSQPLKGSATVLGGTAAVLRSGYLVNSADLTPQSTDIVMGLIHKQTVNPSTTDGAVACDIETGTFYMKCAGSSDLLTQADVGAKVYLVDNQTIGKTNGGASRPECGTLVNVDSSQPGGFAIKMGTPAPGTVGGP